jgi:hypothetical protein
MWDYGDGSAQDALGAHTYNTNPGQSYTVTLTMKDKNSLLQSFHIIVKNGVLWDAYIDKPIGYCSPQ